MVSGQLVAVLHSRPTGTGRITRQRIEGICRTLGCDSFEIVNLFAAELPSSGSLDAARPSTAWVDGRREIERAICEPSTTAVLLGFGVRPPVGPQRGSYVEQLDWLANLLHSTGHVPWTYGNRTSHPSRWQRVAHRHTSGGSVYELAAELLQQHDRGTWG